MGGGFRASLAILTGMGVAGISGSASPQNLPFGQSFHPPSAVGKVLLPQGDTLRLGYRLVSGDSLPPDGSGNCMQQSLPEDQNPVPLPPFSVVKVLAQRSFVVGPQCLPGSYVATWYKVAAIDERGTPLVGGDGRPIAGWDNSRDYGEVPNPFAAAQSARRQAEEAACPLGQRRPTSGAFGRDPATFQPRGALPNGEPVEINGAVWDSRSPSGVFCLVRVVRTGANLLLWPVNIDRKN